MNEKGLVNKKYLDTLMLCNKIDRTQFAKQGIFQEIYDSQVDMRIMLKWAVKQKILNFGKSLLIVALVLRCVNTKIDTEENVVKLENFVVDLMKNYTKYVERKLYISMLESLTTQLRFLSEKGVERTLHTIRKYKICDVDSEHIIKLNDRHMVVKDTEVINGDKYLVLDDFEHKYKVFMIVIRQNKIEFVSKIEKDKHDILDDVISDREIDFVIKFYDLDDEVYVRKLCK